MIAQTKTTSNVLSRAATTKQLQTAPNNSKKKPKGPLRVHSADIPYLETIAFYQTKARNKKCYLTGNKWNPELIKFGGKKLHPDSRKTKRQKLEAMGWLISFYENGNRNKEKIVQITPAGLQGLAEWKASKLRRLKSYTQTQKNTPAECKKHPGEIQKTPRPLSIGLVTESNDHAIAKRKEEPDPTPLHKTLLALGLYKGFAKRVLETHSEQHIRTAFQRTQKVRPHTPGAYFTKVLEGLVKEQNKDHKDYGLEEKSRREKEAEFRFAAKRSGGPIGIGELVSQIWQG